MTRPQSFGLIATTVVARRERQRPGFLSHSGYEPFVARATTTGQHFTAMADRTQRGQSAGQAEA